MKATIAVLAGDGIGADVTREAVKALRSVARVYGHVFAFPEGLIGGCAIDLTGKPLPPETLAICRQSDAIILGAIGGPKWDDPRAAVRPEQGLLGLRKELGLYANLRPVKLYPCLLGASTLKDDVVSGVDLIVVRELTGGLYFGQPSKRWEEAGSRHAVDTLVYSESEVERVVQVACDLARSRRKKVTSVDKQNVLSTSRLWREVASEVAKRNPDISVEHMLVDTCAMRLVRSPREFDVVVTENMFGDILTDEASVIAGSMGMLPSASLAAGTFGMYEPIHGSAPDLAGTDSANPIATVLSAAMLLRISLGLTAEAEAVERAVQRVLDDNYRTVDIQSPGTCVVGTREMGDLIAARISAA
uniref:3-isopropylmalate dehydrogenase n=1 Tax=uncultured bacterium F25-01 TaxID=1191433 RepID=I3VIG8_9BACT|nr:3-isopropylmalate dehydrogenase [uncultured bacterium F25-01]